MVNEKLSLRLVLSINTFDSRMVELCYIFELRISIKLSDVETDLINPTGRVISRPVGYG